MNRYRTEANNHLIVLSMRLWLEFIIEVENIRGGVHLSRTTGMPMTTPALTYPTPHVDILLGLG